jgi:hypothetical protein
MAGTSSYAVLLRDAGRPDAERIRRAFGIFSHLTDADAIRLAANAQGILLRHLGADEGRALLRSLQAEGVPAALVNEAELNALTASQMLARVEIQPDALTVINRLGQASSLPWREIMLVAAGAVPHLEITSSASYRTQLETKSQFVLWLVTATHHYEILGQQFTFPADVDRGLTTLVEKLVSLIKAITAQTPQALQNRAVRDISNGVKLLRGYPSRQALRDETAWLLWRQSHPKRAGLMDAP